MKPILEIKSLHKKYKNGFHALNGIDLSILDGEIFALLGPNGAGKTTLIGTVCGLTERTSGEILFKGMDIKTAYRTVRSEIGLVPQELALSTFEKVIDTVTFSRGLFGLPHNPGFIEQILRNLSLWEKRNQKIITLSGGMKRRVMIAKALAHEPKLLFLDEPTAGVDVELRKDMWAQMRKLRDSGVSIVLTTHFIEEAEQMAERIGIINGGKLILAEKKETLMRKLGKKELKIEFKEKVSEIPESLSRYKLRRSADGFHLIYDYDSNLEENGIVSLLEDLSKSGLKCADLNTRQSSLEEIFVNLVRG